MQTVRTDAFRVKELRKELGLSVRGLATATGMHETHLSHVEAGRRSFTLTDTFRVARALGVAADEITVVTDDGSGEVGRGTVAVRGETGPAAPLAAS